MGLWPLLECGLAVLLPLSVALGIVGLHLMAAHWTAKKGKLLGRVITDASDESFPGSTLNGSLVKEMVDAIYGVIVHPTIEMIVLMYLAFMDSHEGTSWDEVDIWKCDLRAAFTLLFWRPEHVPLFAMELVGGVVIVFLAGTFGWTGTPGAFQVVTRALVFELCRILRGMVLMYVDDIMGISLRRDLASDLTTTKQLVLRLLGSKAFADDKTFHTTVSNRRLEKIGYTIDLGKQLVTIARHNWMKTFYGFIVVDENAALRVSVLECLASWASRYGKVCALMRPYASVLYGSYRGLRSRNVTVYLQPEAKRVIWLFRALLCALWMDEERFARPFRTFRVRIPRYVARFDSSLKGLGLLIGVIKGDPLHPVWVGGGAASLLVLEFGENSAYQNLSEFIGVVIVCYVLSKLGLAMEAVELQGDSETALTWSVEQRYRGKLVTNAAVVYTLLGAKTGVRLECSRHLEAAKNTECDGLSRGLSLEGVGLSGVPDLRLQDDPIVCALIELCRPPAVYDANDPPVPQTEAEFLAFWQGVRSVIAIIATV